jgi:hypothetical protein
MKRTVWLCGVVAGVALATVAGASVIDFDATQHDATYLGYGHSSVLRFERFGNQMLMTQAGQLRFDIDGWETIAFCVDKYKNAGTGPMTSDDITSLNRWNEISWLYDTYAGVIDSNAAGAALAVSIWECLYEAPENPLSLSDGTYWLDNRLFNDPLMDLIINMGNSMLASLAYMPANYTSHNDLWVLRSAEHQDILIPGGKSIPEPLTMTMLALGGVGLLVKSRKMLTGKKRRGDAVMM